LLGLVHTSGVPVPVNTFVFEAAGDHRHRHSFPTRRSSDLVLAGGSGVEPEVVASAPLKPGVSTRFEFDGNLASGYYVYARLPSKDRKSTRLNSSHVAITYAVFCLKKKKSCGSMTYMSCTTS